MQELCSDPCICFKVQQDLANSRGQRSRCVRLASELKQINDLEAKMKLIKKEDSTLSTRDTSRPTTRNSDTIQGHDTPKSNLVRPSFISYLLKPHFFWSRFHFTSHFAVFLHNERQKQVCLRYSRNKLWLFF